MITVILPPSYTLTLTPSHTHTHPHTPSQTKELQGTLGFNMAGMQVLQRMIREDKGVTGVSVRKTLVAEHEEED